MKKSLLPCILLLLLGVTKLSAQHEWDIWYFGNGAGMDFNSGAPVNLTDGNTYTVEGTAAISTPAGSLLFYTEGVSVWNKQQNVMNNGTGLYGGNSSSQSALILPLPGSDSLYYIFTTGAQGSYGFSYSIVDMSLQGGNGQVIVKNVPVASNTNEQLTAVKQPNGIDYWVLVHKTGSNEFDAFQFDATGLSNSAVVSTVGTATASQIGYLKPSHNGKKLALSDHLDFFFELYDFDNSTGVVSNPVYLGCPAVTLGPYGIEFSPNDSMLYGAPFEPPVVYEWDISSGIASVIVNSEVLIGTATGTYGGALALASDGKIYMAKYNTQSLSTINNPNVYGAGCNFVDAGFNLSPKWSQAGLPNFIIDNANTNQLPSAQFAVSDSSVCGISCLSFTDMSGNNPTSWQWDFPGANPSSSTDQNPQNICYTTPGSYDVTLVVSNASGNDTIVLNNFITIYSPPSVSLSQSNDTLFASSAQSYQWYTNGNSIPGATDFFYTPSAEGYYSVTISDLNGCSATDTIFFSLAPLTNFSTPSPVVCEKFCLNFTDQSGNNPTTWHWIFEGGIPSSSFVQNPPTICYNAPGTYDVTLITSNAFGSDTLVLSNYITVNPTPPFPTITQNGYTLSCSPADTYQWQLNSYDIPGATNQSYVVMQTGFYTVLISDSTGCVNSASVYVLIDGIDDLIGEQGIFISPNPSSGDFSFQILNSEIEGEVSVEIVNALGQKVFSSTENISGNEFTKHITLNNTADGIYFLEVKNDHLSLTRKIILTKK